MTFATTPNRRANSILFGLFVMLLGFASTAQGQATDLVFSEYVEGSSFNKALELYNGTETSVDLAAEGYQIEIYFNGSTSAGTTVSLTGVVAAGDVYVVADDGADATILAATDQTSTANFFNGDDAIVLRKGGGGGAIVDVIGQVGFDPGSEWSGGGIGTQNETLRRMATTCLGDTDPNDDFDPSEDWLGFAQDTFDGLGTHTADCGGPPPAPMVLINEIHADPADGPDGDANGDGTRHFGDDEFVEIVNTATSDIDLAGWTISDAVGVRHTFAAGSVVTAECAVLVFGGGNPTGEFGHAAVQTASTNALGLNNGGDSLTLSDADDNVVATYTYGGEGGDNQSLTRAPDITGGEPLVKHSTAAGSGGALFSPGTQINGLSYSGCADDPTPSVAEIYEIQSSGAASPFAGQTVTTEDNVVTATAPNGFFMQTPTTRSDNNVDTSDGIFVFTGGAPSVEVGDLVDVTGEVVEFFDFTEFSEGPTVTVTGTGTLPAPVTFNSMTPSPDPTSPSCAIEFECYEGMLIQINGGVVGGPNQYFGSDPRPKSTL